jgi:hypothetical protein
VTTPLAELAWAIRDYLDNDGSNGRYDAAAMIAARGRLRALLPDALLDAARRPPEREALAAILHTEASERVLGKFGVGLALEWADAVRELVAALPQPVPTDR